MICALGLFLSLTLAPRTSARLVVKDGRQAIEVVHGGRKDYLFEARDSTTLHRNGIGLQMASRVLAFKGKRYSGDEYRVRNLETKELAQAFDRPVNTYGVGLVYGGKIVWSYSLADGDNMGEPLVSTCVFVMDVQKGELNLEKTIELPGIQGHVRSEAGRFGDWLLVYSDSSGDRSLGILNLRSYRYLLIVKTWNNRVEPRLEPRGGVPNTGSFAISLNGNVYASIGDMLNVWNWKELEWTPVRKLKAERWSYAYDLGPDDLIVGENGMALAHIGRPFALPPSRSLFVSPKLGIGVVYNASFPSAEGVLLSSKDLSLICKVEKYIPAAAKDRPVRATMTTGKR